jgi:hypothetical protein
VNVDYDFMRITDSENPEMHDNSEKEERAINAAKTINERKGDTNGKIKLF